MTLYLSMFGNVCDRIHITRDEGVAVLRWLEETNPSLSPTVRAQVRGSVSMFEFEFPPESVEIDADAGHIATLRYCLDMARAEPVSLVG